MINWLDTLLLALVFFGAVMGWRRGMARQVFELAAMIGSYVVALRYGNDAILWVSRYVPLASWLPRWFTRPTPFGFTAGDIITRLLGFLLLFAVVRLFFFLAAEVAHGVFSLPLLGTVNGLGGLLFGTLKSLLLVLILVAIFKLLPAPFWQQSLENSAVAQAVLYYAPIVYSQMVAFLLKDLI